MLRNLVANFFAQPKNGSVVIGTKTINELIQDSGADLVSYIKDTVMNDNAPITEEILAVIACVFHMLLATSSVKALWYY